MMHGSHTHAHAPETTGSLIRWARYYDLVTSALLLGNERSIRDMVVEIADVKPGDKVLDVGCGTGSLTLAAWRRAGTDGEVHGIDASPEMIQFAQDKTAKVGAPIDFQIGLVEHIPFPDDYFDVVLSSLMLHHLPDDLKRRAFAEIRRVLKPGGYLFAVDFEPPKNRLALHVMPHLIVHNMMHVNVRDYVPMMESAGFSNVRAGHTDHSLLSSVRGYK